MSPSRTQLRTMQSARSRLENTSHSPVTTARTSPVACCMHQCTAMMRLHVALGHAYGAGVYTLVALFSEVCLLCADVRVCGCVCVRIRQVSELVINTVRGLVARWVLERLRYYIGRSVRVRDLSAQPVYNTHARARRVHAQLVCCARPRARSAHACVQEFS